MKLLFTKTIVGALLLVATATIGSASGQQVAPISPPNAALKAYLRKYLGPGADLTTRINIATVKMDGGKEEEIVYVSGPNWCGSGGCLMLILEPVGPSFKPLGRVTIVQLPIRVLLPSTNNGHPDIGVYVSGGGILPGYEAVLSFNGTRYPSNPSVPPARKTTTNRGKVVIATTAGSELLYK